MSKDPYLSTHEQRVVAQVRAFLTSGSAPGPGNARRILQWWRVNGPAHYADLMPGVRILLSLPAGNGGVERFFGKAKWLLSAHRLLNQLTCLYLRVNCPQLGVEGYPQDPEEQDEDADDDVEICIDLLGDDESDDGEAGP